MPNAYYVRRHNKQFGPFDAQKIRQLAASGKITRDDSISQDGQQWMPAGNVKGLFPPAELIVDDKSEPIPTIVPTPPTLPRGLPAPEKTGDVVLDALPAVRKGISTATVASARAATSGAKKTGAAAATAVVWGGSSIAKAMKNWAASRARRRELEELALEEARRRNSAARLEQGTYPVAGGVPGGQQIIQQTVVVNAAPPPGNTCATLAGGLGLIAVLVAFVPGLGLLVIFPLVGLALLLALFGFIIALTRGGTGLVGSIGGGLLALVAIPIAVASTAAGIGAGLESVNQAAQEAQWQADLEQSADGFGEPSSSPTDSQPAGADAETP